MSATRRWLLVVLGILGLVAVPVVGRLVPVPDSDVSASALLDRINDSDTVAYSGFVESSGGLQLPVSDDFSDLATLLGERTRMRVWWRGGDDWRVDAIEPTGETDLIHDATGTTIWEYAANRATRTIDTDIRLPRPSDVLPPTLARLLLDEATRAEVHRIDPERIAGRNAPGLRFTPADAQSSLDRIDVWADPETGLPLRVTAYGGRQRTPAITTSFRDLSTSPPSPDTTRFTAPPGAEQDFDDVVDIAAAADRFADIAAPPDELAGLARRDGDNLGAVGEYGRGPTRLLAIPLWDDAADSLRDQMATTPGARVGPRGTRVVVGPLGLLLTPCRGDASVWLLGGTVTGRTLSAAADELAEREGTAGS